MGLQAVMRREFVPFIVAFSIAEFLYKFKSFALECIAFLITWYLLSLLQSLFMRSQR
ncbi:MAG: hypothetical protein AAGA28_18465 [Pseudomonadota bacterium]